MPWLKWLLGLFGFSKTKVWLMVAPWFFVAALSAAYALSIAKVDKLNAQAKTNQLLLAQQKDAISMLESVVQRERRRLVELDTISQARDARREHWRQAYYTTKQKVERLIKRSKMVEDWADDDYPAELD